jgi:excinuclease ABC subunit A
MQPLLNAEILREDMMKVERSYTGRFLKGLLERRPGKRVAAE